MADITKVREHYSAMGLTDRIKSALATVAPILHPEWGYNTVQFSLLSKEVWDEV